MTTFMEPCPFCNSGHLLIAQSSLSHAVMCKICKSTGPQRGIVKEAVLDWNHSSRLLRTIKRVPARQALFISHPAKAANG